jgi:hypothetical protein
LSAVIEKPDLPLWPGPYCESQARKQAAAQGKIGPPFLDIKPKDMRVDRLTDEVALVTFHLGKEPRFQRLQLLAWRLPKGTNSVAARTQGAAGTSPNSLQATETIAGGVAIPLRVQTPLQSP